MEKNIIESFGNTIYKSIKDTTIDYAEIGIDLLTEEYIGEIAKEIPFVKSIYAVKNAIVSIKDRRELKNFLIFFNEIRKNNLSETVRKKHIERLSRCGKKIEEELELLIIILSKIENDVKNEMIADVYSAYVLNENMPYFLFADMIKIIEQMFLTDFFIFGAYYKSESTHETIKDKSSISLKYLGKINTYEATISIERLCRLGLVTPKSNYRLKNLNENDKFIQNSPLHELFPNIEPNLLGQTLHSIIIDELDREFLNINRRRKYELE